MLYLIFSSVIVAVLTLLTAQPAYVINGQVQDNTGKPACGVRVCAIAEDFDRNKPHAAIPCALSDAQGKFASETEKLLGVNLTAPVQLSPANDIVFDHYPRTTKLEWSPVEGAVSYSIEVDYCEGMRTKQGCVNPQPLKIRNNPPTSGMVSTTYEFQFVGAQPGRWRVWALDKQGREGFKSPWRGFVYLR